MMQTMQEMCEGYTAQKSIKGFAWSWKGLSFPKPQNHRIPNRIQSASKDKPGDYAKNQGRPLIPPRCYLKIDVIGEVEVVGVGDDVDPEDTCRRANESLVDENAEIFDTILVGDAIETARGKLETIKD